MQDLDTMTNVILNNEYKLHEEEQKTNFESGNNGNNNQNNNSNKTKKRRKKKKTLKQKLLLRKLDFKYIFSYKANNNIRSYDIGRFSVNKYQRTNLK